MYDFLRKPYPIEIKINVIPISEWTSPVSEIFASEEGKQGVLHICLRIFFFATVFCSNWGHECQFIVISLGLSYLTNIANTVVFANFLQGSFIHKGWILRASVPFHRVHRDLNEWRIFHVPFNVSEPSLRHRVHSDV